ncbi:hypothetical protein SY83_02060 [Paenibacillus swuensis]|uniref:ABC transporter substrate-binding protein n=1 Tax=Paenibacillus swuensis TaxID=1178515 RepID=A0A172TEI7_9BACL|nr:ABC transporter substrate-binding protein [Paenibacillus swuensis]ANE45314.1 hypothetical protein SY83_02060 [Paenibacillus swuensis]
MKRQYTTVSLALILLIICTIGAGYGISHLYLELSAPKETDTTDALPLEKTIELQIFEGGYGRAFWRDAIEQFQKENPDIKVTANIGYNVNEQMKLKWLSGNAPDLVFTDGANFPKALFQMEGKFKEVSAWLDNLEVSPTQTLGEVIMPETIGRYGDKLYILPYMLTSWGMWYDQHLLDRYMKRGLDDFTSLLETGREMKKNGIALIGYPGQFPLYLIRGLLIPGLIAEGGEQVAQQLLSADPALYDSEVFVRYMKRLEKLAQVGLLLKYPVKMNHIHTQKEWLAHNIAYIPSGMWLRNEMASYLPETFQLKRVDGILNETKTMKDVRVISSVGFAVSANTRHEEEARRFIAFLYREDTLQKMVSMLQTPAAGYVNMDGLPLEENMRTMQLAFQQGTIRPIKLDFIDPKFEQRLTQAAVAYLDGQRSLDATIAWLKEVS